MPLFIPILMLAAAQQSDLEPRAKAILAKNCVSCHNATAKLGGLVLESKASAGAAIARIPAKVTAGQMPPGNPLPAADRDVLAKWVNAGAPWTGRIEGAPSKRADKDFWSLQPVKPVTGGIDSLLDAAMSAKGLKPAAHAGKRTLIRRATFDLTGLPPTPPEIEAFLADASLEAYPKLIDRLLSSPAYGERWGRHWMDVIRFGESHGYEQNHLRPNAWPFRDYIIRSWNEDKPYDRMVLEHIAGDQLANGDPAIAVATGFLVAGPHDTVGNQSEAARRQQRADDLDDMINGTASAFLGLTVNCARCHDHKFDPIQQADYYRVAATFAGVTHAEGELATGEQRKAYADRLAPLESAMKEARRRIAAIQDGAPERAAGQREAILSEFRPAVSSKLTEETFPATAARFVRLRIEAVSNNGVAALDEIEVFAGGRNVARGVQVTASSTRKADDDANAYSETHLTDGKYDRRWFAANNQPSSIVIDLGKSYPIEKVAFSRDRTGGFQERFEGPMPSVYFVEVSDNNTSWREAASSAGRRPASEAELSELVLKAVLTPSERAEYDAAVTQLKDLQGRMAGAPKLPAAYIGRFAEPTEPVYLLKRGNVMDRGEAVESGPLSMLAHQYEVPANEGGRRLAFARWIADPRNPLTARVMANRLWHYHFGRGIVGTPSDFGYNGERPTHPELLDYLASRLIHHGWRLKPLHREIMLSRAYQRSSAHDEASARIDSESRYLWRFPPRRLEAEAIRDSILAVSGKLDEQAGGPGFRLFRYTVDNVATYYPLDKFGEDTYRRSVYQQAARSVRSEMLGQYDCPDSSLPEPRRIVTVSPPQALSLMNNSFLLDQAKSFAERLQRDANTADARIARAFALAFGRSPEPDETAAARQLIEAHGPAAFARAIFNANEFIHVF